MMNKTVSLLLTVTAACTSSGAMLFSRSHPAGIALTAFGAAFGTAALIAALKEKARLQEEDGAAES